MNISSTIPQDEGSNGIKGSIVEKVNQHGLCLFCFLENMTCAALLFDLHGHDGLKLVKS
jgi:hypothetical protein